MPILSHSDGHAKPIEVLDVLLPLLGSSVGRRADERSDQKGEQPHRTYPDSKTGGYEAQQYQTHDQGNKSGRSYDIGASRQFS